jgi:aminopeptidase N
MDSSVFHLENYFKAVFCNNFLLTLFLFKNIQMKKPILTWTMIIIVILMQSCSLTGIHFNLQNPRHAGKPPKYTEERIILGELTRYRSCFDVYYYDLSVEVFPDEKTIEGKVLIYARATDNFDTLQIDLHPNFTITQLADVESNTSLTFSRKERAIFIPLSRKKNDNIILKVCYRGKPVIAKKPPWVGGFVWKKDDAGNHWDGVACESYGASLWWPLKDHTSDEPDSMRMHYTVPGDLMAVGNGQSEGKTELTAKSTWHWFVSYPINAYNVTIYVGKFKAIEDEYTGITGKTMKMTHYVLEKNYEKAREHFKQIHSILNLYERRFGEYPWYRDGFRLVESPYAGMEHQSAIAYGNGYENDADSVTDFIILHETAHEWWGNCITARDLAHVWIQEGFATYAECLYFEDKDGKVKMENELWFKKMFIQNRYPIISDEGRMWFDYKKSIDVYNKGALILHTLRVQINDDSLFFDIIKTFYERYKYGLVNSSDFIAVVNEKTGKDYNWFFNHYLYNHECPVLGFIYTNDGVVYYKWLNVNPDFNKMKLKINALDKVLEITPSGRVQKLLLPKDRNGGWEFKFADEILVIYRNDKYLLEEFYSKP